MNSKSKQTSFWLAITLYVIANSAYSHQQKESYTTVTINARTEKLEVMQRFYLHDAEHALNLVTGGKANLALDEQAQAKFASYISQSFGLLNAAGKPISLEFIGFETEGKYLWVYQEGNPPGDMSKMSVKMTSLQDVWSQQINHINFELLDQVKSVRLSHLDNWVEVVF
ncbi:MAG: hypothetical protein HWE27_07330 [Gammaproteobacteria bacterium]|nr:hypothetical protein [Gammaproteobacteria bacterium]